MAALPFDLVERNAINEVARLNENVELRFSCVFCGGFEGVAVAIWLEERKSENAGAVRGTGRMLCSAGVKIARGLSASEELGGISTRGLASRSYLTPASQHTNRILLLLDLLLVWSKAMPHRGIDCLHES